MFPVRSNTNHSIHDRVIEKTVGSFRRCDFALLKGLDPIQLGTSKRSHFAHHFFPNSTNSLSSLNHKGQESEQKWNTNNTFLRDWTVFTRPPCFARSLPYHLNRNPKMIHIQQQNVEFVAQHLLSFRLSLKLPKKIYPDVSVSKKIVSHPGFPSLKAPVTISSPTMGLQPRLPTRRSDLQDVSHLYSSGNQQNKFKGFLVGG